MQHLELIPVLDAVLRGTEMNYEMVDGVLNFFVNYNCFVYKVDEKILMETMQSHKTNVKGQVIILTTTKKEEVTKSSSFSKEQILSAAKFANRRDLLSVVLEDGKTYTVEDVQKQIDKFMKGKVTA